MLERTLLVRFRKNILCHVISLTFNNAVDLNVSSLHLVSIKTPAD